MANERKKGVADDTKRGVAYATKKGVANARVAYILGPEEVALPTELEEIELQLNQESYLHLPRLNC